MIGMQNKLGSKPSLIPSEFDSPSIWSTLGLLISEVQNIENLHEFKVNKMANAITTSVRQAVFKDHEALHERIDRVKDSLISCSNKVQELIEDQNLVEEEKFDSGLVEEVSRHHIRDDISMNSASSDSSLSSKSSKFTTYCLIDEPPRHKKPNQPGIIWLQTEAITLTVGCKKWSKILRL